MPVKNYRHAAQTIRTLQQELSTLKQTTYKTVHDDIGSTISAASIKAKILSDKVKDTYEKQQLSEIHSLIKETVEHVTLLNKKLKTTWIPQGTETLFSDLKNQFEKFEKQFNVHIDFQIANEHAMKKLTFPSIVLIYEWVQLCLNDALARIASLMIFNIQILSDSIEWKFLDSAPIASEMETFKTLIEKAGALSGTLHHVSEDGKHGALLVLPFKEEK